MTTTSLIATGSRPPGLNEPYPIETAVHELACRGLDATAAELQATADMIGLSTASGWCDSDVDAVAAVLAADDRHWQRWAEAFRLLGADDLGALMLKRDEYTNAFIGEHDTDGPVSPADFDLVVGHPFRPDASFAWILGIELKCRSAKRSTNPGA